MTRNQILSITLCCLTCLWYSTVSVNAGWFGPSNYQECVLGKMKGQAGDMLPTAQSACNLQFPCPDKYHKDEYDAGFGECIDSFDEVNGGKFRITLEQVNFCGWEAKRKACPDR